MFLKIWKIWTICKLSLTAALVIPIGLFAQNVAPANPPNTPISTQGPTIYVVGGGLFGDGVYVAPNATFSSPPTTTGVSQAGRAGISLNEPFSTGVQSTLPEPLYYYGSPIAYGTASSGIPESGPAIHNLLPSYSSEGRAQTPSSSVAVVAARYKATRAKKVSRFTKTDAQRIAKNVSIAGATISGANQSAVSPTNPPAAAPNPPAQEKQKVPKNVTPPISTEQPAQAATGNTPTNRLPATSTPLPLLTLAGLLSGGLGLWLRRKLSR